VAAAAFFDLDKTIIAGSSALAFRRPLQREGLITRRALLRSSYAQLLLLISGAGADTMEHLRRRITELSAGWEVAQVHAIVAETLPEIVRPLVYVEAQALVAEHRTQGHEIVVLSASGAEVVGPISALLGADTWRATRMRTAAGRYTGEIEFYCYGEAKAQVARDIAAEKGYRMADCMAYSDSITDLPLLEAVGHPTAVNPDRALRRVALERGWPVLTFAHPAAPGVRLRGPAAATAGAVTLAALFAVALGAGRAERRRRDKGPDHTAC